MVKITKAYASRSLCAMLSHSEMSDYLQSHGLQPARLLYPQRLSRQEYRSGLPCPPPGDLPNPRIEPRSPTFQANYLLSEPLGKPKNTGVAGLSLIQGIFQTQESNWGLLHCRRILYQFLKREAPFETEMMYK